MGSTLLPPGDAERLAAFLREGGRVAVLTGAARGAEIAVLDAAFWAAEGRVIRTGNPLSSPLSLSRLLLQVGADPHAEDEARAFMGEIAAQAQGRGVVLSISDAHTLEPDVLPVLRDLLWPAEGEPAAVQLVVQLVVSGRGRLLDRLAEAGFRGLDDPAQTLVLRVGPDDGVAADAPGLSAPRPVMSEALIPPPPPPLVTAVRAGEPPPRPVAAVPLPPAQPVLLRTPSVTDAGMEAAPGVAVPARRRWLVLVLAAFAGLCTGLLVGLTVLWLLGGLGFLGLPPSPLRRFLFEWIPPARPAAMSAMPAVVAPPLDGVAPAVAPGLAPVLAPRDAGPAVASPPVTPPSAVAVPPEVGPPPAAVAPAAVPDEPPRAPPVVVPPVPAPATQMAVSAPVLVPGMTEARLRRDFDAYLRHTGWNGAVRTAEAREALFRDYKDWLARNRTGLAPGRADAAP